MSMVFNFEIQLQRAEFLAYGAEVLRCTQVLSAHATSSELLTCTTVWFPIMHVCDVIRQNRDTGYTVYLGRQTIKSRSTGPEVGPVRRTLPSDSDTAFNIEVSSG